MSVPSHTPRKSLALALQLLIVFFSLSGIIVNLSLVDAWAARLQFFSFYTLQSNLIVAAALLPGLYYLLTDRPEPPLLVIFKSGALLWILVTGIVFALLLAGLWQPQGLWVYVNLALHYLAPIGMLLNWLLFEKKGRYRWSYALIWLTYPLLYSLVSWLRGALTGWYPYWFLNPTAPYPTGAGSLPAMLLLIGGLLLAFLGLGLLIIIIDRLAGRRARGGPA
jgi:hypothetical protein